MTVIRVHCHIEKQSDGIFSLIIELNGIDTHALAKEIGDALYKPVREVLTTRFNKVGGGNRIEH